MIAPHRRFSRAEPFGRDTTVSWDDARPSLSGPKRKANPPSRAVSRVCEDGGTQRRAAASDWNWGFTDASKPGEEGGPSWPECFTLVIPFVRGLPYVRWVNLRLATALGMLLLASACSHSSAATQPRTISRAEALARWHSMKLAVRSYNDAVASTKDDVRYCDLVSGTNASQCVVTTAIQPLRTAVLQVNVAMKSLAEAALDSPGVCSSYLNETVKRGNAVADGLDRLMHAASGSPNVVSVIHRMTPALAQQQKYWGQDIAAMLNTCGIVPEKSRP